MSPQGVKGTTPWDISSTSNETSCLGQQDCHAPFFKYKRLSYLPPPSGSLWVWSSSFLTRLSLNKRFVDMNILPIVPNAIAKRMSEPSRKERKPTASIIALPSPFVSFELVGTLPTFRGHLKMWACSPPPAILRSEAIRIRFGSELRRNKGKNSRRSLFLTESPSHWQLEDLWDLE